MQLKVSEILELENLSLVERAKLFATWAHEGQTRADNTTPYIEHPKAVVAILQDYEKTGIISEEMIASAWLHDTIEDCDVTAKDIKNYFGIHVCITVQDLTFIDKKLSFSQKTEHLCEMAKVMNDDAKWIKMADRFHNLQSSKNVWEPLKIRRYAEQGLKMFEAMRLFPVYSYSLAQRVIDYMNELTEEDNKHAKN